MQVRLGELLVEHGVLTAAQVQQVLDHQRRTGQPFGLVCEDLFGIDPDAVEHAWAVQYAGLTRTIRTDQEAFEPRALDLVTRRQAWQFRVLPVRFDGEELMIATTMTHLRRALRFATRIIGVPVYFVLADADDLGAALCRHYPLAGMVPASIDDSALDHLLERTRAEGSLRTSSLF